MYGSYCKNMEYPAIPLADREVPAGACTGKMEWSIQTNSSKILMQAKSAGASK
jgi:hypothetical protein